MTTLTALEAVVRHLIDGDTAELEGGTRVLILLVDPPEATKVDRARGSWSPAVWCA